MSWSSLSCYVLLFAYVFSSKFGCNIAQCSHSIDIKSKLDSISNTLLNVVKELEVIKIQNRDCSLTSSQTAAYSQIDVRDISEDIRRTYKIDNELAGNTLIQKNHDLIADLVRDIASASSDNLDILVDFSRSLKNVETRLLVLCAIQNEMHTNNNKNPFKLITLAAATESNVKELKTETLKKRAQTVIKDLIRDITDASSNFLARAMIAKNYKQNDDVSRLFSAVLEFRSSVLNAVMDQLVDAVFGIVSAEDLLENISSHKETPQVAVGLLAVFNRLNYAGNLNSEATVTLSAHLRELRLRTDYGLMDWDLLHDVNKAIVMLPTCAKNLMFSSNICLWNKGMRSYLYAGHLGDKYDHDRRNIFVIENNVIRPGGVWNLEKIGRDYFFKSIDYPNEYMYAATYAYKGDYYIFNFIPGNNTDPQSGWNFELDGDYCYLKSTFFNQYAYSSDLKYHDSSQKHVLLWGKGDPIKTDAFQWQVRHCPSFID